MGRSDCHHGYEDAVCHERSTPAGVPRRHRREVHLRVSPAQPGKLPWQSDDSREWLAVSVARKASLRDRTIRGLLLGLALLVVVAVAFSDLLGGMMGSGLMGQGPSGPGMMQGRWWMRSLGMFIFWGVLLISLALVARALGVGRGRHRSPRDKLKRRYEAGELTREQYERTRKDREQ